MSAFLADSQIYNYKIEWTVLSPFSQSHRLPSRRRPSTTSHIIISPLSSPTWETVASGSRTWTRSSPAATRKCTTLPIPLSIDWSRTFLMLMINLTTQSSCTNISGNTLEITLTTNICQPYRARPGRYFSVNTSRNITFTSSSPILCPKYSFN